jgi:tetratricopeptide (TPR) repeat protein
MPIPVSERYQQLLRQFNTAIGVGDLEQAGVIAEQALQAGPERPQLLFVVGYRRLQMQQPSEAVALLERARALTPDDQNVLNALGIALRQAGRPAESREVLETATNLHPDNASAHFNKGTACEDMGDHEAAARAYEAAVAAQPDFTDALARLSYLTALKGDREAAAELAGKAERIPSGAGDPDPMLAFTLARAEVETGNFEGGLSRLRNVAERAAPNLRASIYGLVGDCYNGLGNSAAAFDYYVKSKSEQREIFASKFVRPEVEPFIDQVRRLRAFFIGQPAPWRGDEDGPSGALGHAFLVGFPRSGTTLIETALGGHPSIATTEERETLDEAVQAFIQPSNGLELLANASRTELMRYREYYWKKIREGLPAIEGKLILDKLPLNVTTLGLIAKLFPNARVLFALRDPRDCVLSCFRHTFAMNIAMYEFCTLEGTARLYDVVMQLADVYRAKLVLPLLETRYEDTVADLEGSMRKILSFLGVPFDPCVLDFQKRALARPMTTPSVQQLARGLYSGAGQWRAYQAQLAPVLSILAPWVRRFGYA